MLVQDCMCVHLLVRVGTFVCVLVSFVRGCHYAHALRGNELGIRLHVSTYN